MQRVGSRAQVMHGNAKMTGGGLRKKDLKYNKQGKIVSKKMSKLAKKEKRLKKAGYTTRKGQFGAVRIMKGGASKNSELNKLNELKKLTEEIRGTPVFGTPREGNTRTRNNTFENAAKATEREAEERAKREAEERAKREAEEKARREAEERANREAEERAKREAEEKANIEAEKRANREVIIERKEETYLTEFFKPIKNLDQFQPHVDKGYSKDFYLEYKGRRSVIPNKWIRKQYKLKLENESNEFICKLYQSDDSLVGRQSDDSLVGRVTNFSNITEYREGKRNNRFNLFVDGILYEFNADSFQDKIDFLEKTIHYLFFYAVTHFDFAQILFNKLLTQQIMIEWSKIIDTQGNTPFMIACSNENLEVVRAILYSNLGSTIRQMNKYKKTAMEIAFDIEKEKSTLEFEMCEMIFKKYPKNIQNKFLRPHIKK